MLKKSRYLYVAVCCINVLICCVAFNQFRLYPTGDAFCDQGDGLKNSYTLLSFVKEPIGPEGIFKYNGFKYPYGDYVYYTDNTALFAVPFRWFCHHVWDLSDQTLPIFNVVILLNIILCGLLLFHVLRRVLKNDLLAVILSIILAWTNIQVMRIWRGHYNLSFSSLIIIAIALLMLWHKYQGYHRKQILAGLLMSLLVFLAAMIHIYYVAIVGLFIACGLFAYGVYELKNKQGTISIIAAAVVPLLGLAATLALIRTTDHYFLLRKEGATGYDWMEEKTLFSHLFSHIRFQNIYFPISVDPPIAEAEKAAYLGNIGLYAFFAFAIAALVSKKCREVLKEIQAAFFSDRMRASIFIAGLLMLSASFGEVYFTAGANDTSNQLRIVNIFNPLLYLHLITNRVEQFRCMGRLMWPFYFTFNIWMGYTIAQLYSRYGVKAKVGIIAAIVFLGGAELMDYIDSIQYNCSMVNYLDRKEVGKVMYDPSLANCQAILPIPFYIVGSENYHLIIDDQDQWSNYTYRLAMRNHLPLIASKLSRTPPVYDSLLLDMVATDRMTPQLYQKLTPQPILVAVNKKLIDDRSLPNIPVHADLAEKYWQCNQFAIRHNLTPIDSSGDIVFYKWYPKNDESRTK
jgi:hypothetical protein